MSGQVSERTNKLNINTLSMPYPIYVGVLKQIKDTIIEPQTTVCNLLLTSGHRDDILEKKKSYFVH